MHPGGTCFNHLLHQLKGIEVTTKSDELDWPSSPPLPPLIDENYWHSVTNDTWDGEDALHVRSPFEGAYYANLRVEFEAPAHIRTKPTKSN